MPCGYSKLSLYWEKWWKSETWPVIVPLITHVFQAGCLLPLSPCFLTSTLNCVRCWAVVIKTHQNQNKMRQNDDSKYTSHSTTCVREEIIFTQISHWFYLKRKKEMSIVTDHVHLPISDLFYFPQASTPHFDSDLMQSPRNCLISVSDEIRSAPAGPLFSEAGDKCTWFSLVSCL